MSKKLEESYSWVKIPDNLPRENLIMVKAKTTKTTIHPEDNEYPVRIFLPDELKEAARSLAQRPVGINHMSIIEGAFTVDANWDEEEQVVEALLFVPDYFIKKIKEGNINKVSVEYTWREEEKTKEGTIFKGLVFNRVDLLERMNAGDSNTEIKPVLMEGMKALMEGIIEKTGETDIKQDLIQDTIDDTLSQEELSEAEVIMKTLGEPKHKDYKRIYAGMIKQYGPEKGKQVYYAWLNKHGYDDTKAFPSKGKEGSVIAKIPEVELKEKNLTGKQVPEHPVNPMASEPTPLQAIHSPIPQPMNPQDKITTIGAIADNKGPITFENSSVPEPSGKGFDGDFSDDATLTVKVGEEKLSRQILISKEDKKESDKLEQSTPIGGEILDNILKDTGVTAKQAVESTSEPKKEEKKEEIKKEESKEEVKQEVVKEEPVKEPEKKEEEKPKEEPKKEEPKPIEQPKVEEKKVEVPKIDAKDVKITELEESIKKLQEAEKKRKEEIEKAKKEAKLEVVKKIEETLPNSNIMSNFNRGGQILANDIKKVIYETKKECGK